MSVNNPYEPSADKRKPSQYKFQLLYLASIAGVANESAIFWGLSPFWAWSQPQHLMLSIACWIAIVLIALILWGALWQMRSDSVFRLQTVLLFLACPLGEFAVFKLYCTQFEQAIVPELFFLIMVSINSCMQVVTLAADGSVPVSARTAVAFCALFGSLVGFGQLMSALSVT